MPSDDVTEYHFSYCFKLSLFGYPSKAYSRHSSSIFAFPKF